MSAQAKSVPLQNHIDAINRAMSFLDLTHAKRAVEKATNLDPEEKQILLNGVAARERALLEIRLPHYSR